MFYFVIIALSVQVSTGQAVGRQLGVLKGCDTLSLKNSCRQVKNLSTNLKHSTNGRLVKEGFLTQIMYCKCPKNVVKLYNLTSACFFYFCRELKGLFVVTRKPWQLSLLLLMALDL